MYPWIWFWAPRWDLPWSGDVAQKIEPSTTWFFDAIGAEAGDGKIERKVFEEVATYGRQLGLITEVLLEIAGTGQGKLSPQAEGSLKRLEGIRGQIDQIKASEDASLAAEIEARLTSLKGRSNTEAYANLREKLLNILND